MNFRLLVFLLAACACVLLYGTARVATASDSSAEESDQEPERDAAWRRDLEKKLERRVTFNFQDTPLNDAIAFLQQISRFNLVLDTELSGDKTVTHSVANATTKEALKGIFSKLNADYLVIDEALFYFPKGKYSLKKPLPPPPLSTEAVKELETWLPGLRADDFEHREKTTKQIKALGAGVLAPLKAALEAEIDPEAQQRLARIIDAFRPAGSLSDLTSETSNQLRSLSQPITFDLQQTTLEDSVAFFSQLTHTNVLCDPAVAKHNVTLRVNAMSVGNAMKWIARLSDTQVVATGDGIKFTAKPKATDPAEKPAAPETKK